MHITELKAEAKRQTLISVTVFDTFLAHKKRKTSIWWLSWPRITHIILQQPIVIAPGQNVSIKDQMNCSVKNPRVKTLL